LICSSNCWFVFIRGFNPQFPSKSRRDRGNDPCRTAGS
jgi:hypothetical protein